MIFNTKRLFPFPNRVDDYFYLMGTHYLLNSTGYYSSHCSNYYGFISFDKKRCLYEKISKKEYFDKRDDFDLACNLIDDVKQRIQLTFDF